MKPAILCTCVLMAATAVSAPVSSQQLRRAVAAADRVVVATGVGVQPLGKQLIAHRLRISTTLRGEPIDELTVIEHKRLSEHTRPKPGVQRLYCLSSFADKAHALGLPGSRAPYFKMTGHPGSNPDVPDVDESAAVELARLILAGEHGVAAGDTAGPLLALVFDGPPGIREEAVGAFIERSALRDALGAPQKGQLMARATGETEDVRFKIALAQLCAEMRLPGTVDALCLSFDAVDDRRFAITVGRIAKALHGEKAIDVLRPHLVRQQHQTTRAKLLLALGATQTHAALEALLRMQRTGGRDLPFVEAALAAHDTRRAREAIAEKR